MMIKKVLVTGANGMLGTHICKELLKQQYEVHAFILPGQDSSLLQDKSIKIVEGDVLNSEQLDSVVAEVDAVIHVAALTDVWPRRSERVCRVNYQGALNVAAAVRKNNLQRLVYISSASAFGHGTLQEPGNEHSAYALSGFGIDYIQSKYDAQVKLLQLHQSESLPVIVVNPTFMIGAYDANLTSGRMVLQLVKGKVPGYSKGGKNFVAAADVAVAAVNALQMGRLGECYIAGNENLTYKGFFAKVKSSIGLEGKLFPMPSWIVLLFGAVSSIMARLLNNKPQLSYSMARFSLLQQYYSSTKAQDELAMPQTPIETAVQSCVAWYRANGILEK